MLTYLNGNVELLDKYHIGFTNAFETDGYSFDNYLNDEIKELEEYCKNNGFDDNNRKNIIYKKIF